MEVRYFRDTCCFEEGSTIIKLTLTAFFLNSMTKNISYPLNEFLAQSTFNIVQQKWKAIHKTTVSILQFQFFTMEFPTECHSTQLAVS